MLLDHEVLQRLRFDRIVIFSDLADVDLHNSRS